MARLGLPAPPDPRDPRDPEDRPGPLARKASRGLTVTLGPKAPRASRASEVCVCYCCCVFVMAAVLVLVRYVSVARVSVLNLPFRPLNERPVLSMSSGT
jgi:hypothetical protein